MSKGVNAIASHLDYCIYVVPKQFAQTTTVAAGPTAIQSSPLYFRKATFVAQKDQAGTANAGTVKVGFSSTDSQQLFVMNPGDERTFEPPAGAKWDFHDMFLRVSNDGDGVAVLYC